MTEQRTDRDRIADLEARLSEARQEKDRLLGLLDKALTTVNSQEQRLRHLEQKLEQKEASPTVVTPKPMKSGEAQKQKAALQISEVDTWAKLKNWFLNA